MQPFYQNSGVTIYNGDSLEVLKQLPDESIQMCVTSPPYWGLRDYGVEGQIGLEKTHEEYVQKLVAVFREVRRVLKKDGVCFVNLGDSYAGSGGTGNQFNQVEKGLDIVRPVKPMGGLKPKDLVGIPWSVAKALQAPYYTGTIKRIEDRIWLAAMIDGEGCMFIHKRKAGQNNGQGYQRKNDSYGAGLEIANCHESIIQRCLSITGRGSICYQDKESRMKNRNQRLYRWNLRSNECRKVIQEIYPYLVGKQHEARLVLGCPSSGPDAEKAHANLIKLHNGFPSDIDFKEPESLYEQGWFLRQDIIWSKLNPMPESVKDRCTKSHEYIFLLTKSQKYYYDAEAIKEEKLDPLDDIRRVKKSNEYNESHPNMGKCAHKKLPDINTGRNKRTVWPVEEDEFLQFLQWKAEHSGDKTDTWTVATQPCKEAHFATFPEKLIEPCILAGSRIGDVVIDPFGGSGTTGRVAKRLNRQAVLIELNPAYIEIRKEVFNQNSLFVEVTCQE